MGKKKIEVEGIEISFNEDDFVSLTDIAKKGDGRPADVIKYWMKNKNTLDFLEAWEEIHNPDFKVVQMHHFKINAAENSTVVTPKKYIDAVNPIGMVSKAGRYGGGTFAHPDIAIELCGWMSARFKVYVTREFRRLKEIEAKRLEGNRTWHITKITDYVDNARILLESIPGQLPEYKRINDEEE
ncbi:MAG: hypothetical protein ACI85O_002491 [Saprospiraceae bacterium]|jgi:hypothetical protein